MSQTEAPAVRGRPRSPEVDQAIREAALALLVESGYGGMSMEGIAALAGVGKAAIYRRWPSKAAVIVDALRGHEAMQVPLPDSGDIRADVEEMLVAMQRGLAGDDGPIIAAFTAEKFRHPELRAEFDRVFVTNRRTHLQRLIREAVERGDLAPATDVELLAETGPAILAHRLLMHGKAPDPKLPRRIVHQLFGSD